MWNQLWNEFEDKATHLVTAGAVEDVIDQTIQWQIEGDQEFVGAPIGVDVLHVPELYSGCPWNHRKRWIAFVTVNPSIHPDEVYPTRTDVAIYGVEQMRQFFIDRFQPDGPLEGPGPLVHGRNGANVVTWRNRNNPVRHGQPTWTRIDRAVRNCLELSPEPVPAAPLGQAAAIIDIVPWKFRK
jgi:hypothetical protein